MTGYRYLQSKKAATSKYVYFYAYCTFLLLDTLFPQVAMLLFSSKMKLEKFFPVKAETDVETELILNVF